MDNFIRQFSWPDDFQTYFFVKVQQITLILRENYSVDFSQPIDRLDPVQLYSSGLFLLVISLLIIITAHYLVYYGISNPIAHFLFTPKKWVSRRSAAASPVARSHLPNTPPKIKLKASPDSKEKSSTVSSAVKSKENILKFNLAFWKAFNYGALFLYGLYFCLYLETDDPWILDYENYIVPIRYYSWPIAIYYHLSMAHYLYGLACLLFEPKLKDFKQMLTHHVVTLGLELCSYYVSGVIHVGAPVMFLHDMSDPLMEMAKLFLYAGNEFLANVFFVLFSVTFIISRDFIFPICLIAPLTYNEIGRQVPYIDVYIIALSTIGVLNIFWSYLILSMIKRHIISGDVKGDIREE